MPRDGLGQIINRDGKELQGRHQEEEGKGDGQPFPRTAFEKIAHEKSRKPSRTAPMRSRSAAPLSSNGASAGKNEVQRP